jgi:hypothetical protein
MLSLYVFSTRENWPFYTLTFIDATIDVNAYIYLGPSKGQ